MAAIVGRNATTARLGEGGTFSAPEAIVGAALQLLVTGAASGSAGMSWRASFGAWWQGSFAWDDAFSGLVVASPDWVGAAFELPATQMAGQSAAWKTKTAAIASMKRPLNLIFCVLGSFRSHRLTGTEA